MKFIFLAWAVLALLLQLASEPPERWLWLGCHLFCLAIFSILLELEEHREA